MKKDYQLSDAEEEIMRLLWSQKDSLGSREILEYFNQKKGKDWKKQTLNTLLSRLLKEAFIGRKSEERKYLYYPRVTQKEYERACGEKFITKAYRGSFLDFVSALSGGSVITEEEAAKIREIMEKE